MVEMIETMRLIQIIEKPIDRSSSESALINVPIQIICIQSNFFLEGSAKYTIKLKFINTVSGFQICETKELISSNYYIAFSRFKIFPINRFI